MRKHLYCFFAIVSGISCVPRDFNSASTLNNTAVRPVGTLSVETNLCPGVIAFSKVKWGVKSAQVHMSKPQYSSAVDALKNSTIQAFTLKLSNSDNGKCQYASDSSVKVSGVISMQNSTFYGDDGVPAEENWNRLMIRLNLDNSEFLAFFTVYKDENLQHFVIDDIESRQTLSTLVGNKLARIGVMSYAVRMNPQLN